jgi:hypothetical protein
MSRSTPATNIRFVISTKLEGATNYNQWQNAMQSKFFQCARITCLSSITRDVTLNRIFFKAHFKEDWKDASQDDEENKVDPFDDELFVQQCFDYALVNGEGFVDWVYNAFTGIQESLSDDIADRITGVACGDVVALLAGINLAVGHTETHDSLDLEYIYTETTMEKDGDNDIMKYTGVLKALTRRLKAAGCNIADKKQQRVLLRGLHQDVFQFFIQDAERHPYESYAKLETALLKAASKERMMQRLSALKPGTTHSAMTTRLGATRSTSTKQEDGNGSRLARIVSEAVMTSMAGVADKRGRDAGSCWQFERTGKCEKGSSCRFSHTKKRERSTSSGIDGDGATKSNKRRGRIGDSEPATKGTNMHCAWHNTNNHNTADCQLFSSPHFQEQLRKVQNGQAIAAVNTTNVRDVNHEFLCVTQLSLENVFACRGTNSKLDMWCVDGGATTSATWDRESCTDIVSCNVRVDGPNSADSFTVTEKGTRRFTALNPDGTTSVIAARDVLISPAFPFHIFSEIKVLRAGATATKKHNSWQFYKPASQGGGPLFHASPRRVGAAVGAALYFIDQPGSGSAADVKAGSADNAGAAPKGASLAWL